VTGEADLRKTYLDSGTAATARHRIWRPTMTALDDKYGGDDFATPDRKFLRGTYVSVPDVTGQTLDGARAMLDQAGFGFADGGTTKSARPAGQVVSSDPAAGDSAAKGTTVTVYTSDGSGVTTPKPDAGATIPDVVGQSVGDATSAMQDAGFSNISYALADDPKGQDVCTVTATDPKGGTTAAPDTAVTIFVAGQSGNGKNNNGKLDPGACT
jgi:beta-lactam-binding protein with PASTA domain